MKINFLVTCVIIVTFLSCGEKHRIKITQLSEKQSFTFRPPENTTNLRLNFEGYMDCDFEAALLHEGAPYMIFKFLQGEVDSTSLLDWYSGELTVRYLPHECVEGELTIDCIFYHQ